jgi:deazaflavin-dependent oxidoreductase (nitroreductase family)
MPPRKTETNVTTALPEPTEGRPTVPFPLVLGLDTFGDLIYDKNGRPLSHAETIRSLVEQGVLADRVGIDFFGIGEHHTNDFPMPAGDVVLAAIAARTSRIHLGSAVIVLSSDDPVRVFQRYSTLNAISGGRAEVILGRGSSIESFPLFGYDLADYERLFEEKTNLFAELMKGGPVTWQGTTRAALRDQDVVPHLESGPFPVWVGVGGSPESVIRAARYGFSLMLAIIGGPPARFAPFSQLYREALREFGQPPRPIGVHAPATSPKPTSKPRRSSGRTGARRSPASARSAASDRQPKSRSPTTSARRRPLRRLARDRRRQDRHQPRAARSEPLRPQVRHARAHPRPDHEHGPALRHKGHTPGSGTRRPQPDRSTTRDRKHPMSRERDSYNQRVIEMFRANGGVVEPGLDLLLLHHVGARSARERVTPLAYWRVDDTSVAVLASNRGAPKHPGWYHNLIANPDAKTEIGTRNVPGSSPPRHAQRTQQASAPHHPTEPLRLHRAQPHLPRDPARHPRACIAGMRDNVQRKGASTDGSAHRTNSDRSRRSSRSPRALR